MPKTGTEDLDEQAAAEAVDIDRKAKDLRAFADMDGAIPVRATALRPYAFHTRIHAFL